MPLLLLRFFSPTPQRTCQLTPAAVCHPCSSRTPACRSRTGVAMDGLPRPGACFSAGVAFAFGLLFLAYHQQPISGICSKAHPRREAKSSLGPSSRGPRSSSVRERSTEVRAAPPGADGVTGAGAEPSHSRGAGPAFIWISHVRLQHPASSWLRVDGFCQALDDRPGVPGAHVGSGPRARRAGCAAPASNRESMCIKKIYIRARARVNAGLLRPSASASALSPRRLGSSAESTRAGPAGEGSSRSVRPLTPPPGASAWGGAIVRRHTSHMHPSALKQSPRRLTSS